MEDLNVGDIVQNSVQRAVIRWLGSIEEISVIGLQLIESTLPGYTDGTCPYDNKRYFDCPHGQGYYVLENGLIESYKTIPKKIETDERIVSANEFNSVGEPLSTSPVHAAISSQPTPSTFSPSVSQTRHSSDNDHMISSSRGVLSRLALEREQREQREHPKSPSSSAKKNPSAHSLSVETDSSPSSRIYRPENYRSTSAERSTESDVYEFTTYNDEDDNHASLLPITNSHSQPLLTRKLSSFGHEYFLSTWTLGRVKSLLENEIPFDNQFCLNVCVDHCNVQNLIDEQINGCLSLVPIAPPVDVRIELIKIFDNVEMIFPSRAIRLYDNDYLLLAILCSYSQCAYVRTEAGWAYTDDDDSDSRQSIVVDEISQMIDDATTDIQHKSEQCLHVLKNASFLYYKLVK